ncbi:MAG: chemotaxis protein CheD [Verrucomicrobia bacterium]|nr:chemotaxis protein CheD [Verrucomicrobiota bacterium]
MHRRARHKHHTIIVGISEMKVSNDPELSLITYSLGSCLGIAIYDPLARVGGMLHAMLPESSLQQDGSRKSPCMFVDSGVPMLFRSAYKLGAHKERIIVKAAGGAELLEEDRYFGIGHRNYECLTELLERNGVRLAASAVGGKASRTMRMELATGKVSISIPGRAEFEL